MINVNLTKEFLNTILNASELYNKLNDEFNRPKVDNTVKAIDSELLQKKNIEIKVPKQQQIFEREQKARDPFVLKNQTGKMLTLWFEGTYFLLSFIRSVFSVHFELVLIGLDERSGVIELKDNQEISLSSFISKNRKGDISRDGFASTRNTMSFKLINSPLDTETFDLAVNNVRFDVVGYNTCIYFSFFLLLS